MPTPVEILDTALHRAIDHLSSSLVDDPDIALRVEFICRNLKNRACTRLLMSCLLAKIHNPEVDIRKPYTEIGDADSFSGRVYDEKYISRFIILNQLPCNATTAFLTPALRNIDFTLTPDVDLVGTPKEVYQATLQLLTDVYESKVAPDDLLAETVRVLLIIRNERQQRLSSMLADLQVSRGNVPLAAETIINLIQQHLATKGASRLPVLVVAAAYSAASNYLGERVLPLEAHNAADRQTQALGDVQITLVNDENVVTAYEMKLRRVSINDIDQAITKVMSVPYRIENYIFITTDLITDEVKDYASTIYDRTGESKLWFSTALVS